MYSRGARAVALLALVATVSACGLPRSGPNKREIFAGAVQKQGDSFVVAVNDRVTRATSVVPAIGFPPEFSGAGIATADIIQPGDVLGLTIYENVDDGILARQGSNAAMLNEVQVDDSGFIFIPYAGRIRAAGNTPERLRQIVTEKLDAQTPDPQVVVRRLAGDGATVSVVGGVAGQGVYPIQRPNRTLSGMLATAGGLSIPPEVARISVLRGSRRGDVWFQDLYSHPQIDIALRNGDRILVERDTRAFTALGAMGAQRRVPFETQNLSAIEAIAQVGGLNTGLADPTGVFVMRNESQEVAQMVLGRDDLIGEQRMVYVLDLTEPNGMFLARDFAIRDGDTVYVTEAPFVQWQKTLGAITGTAGTANSLANLADSN
ncbi:polysaccharide biosynthesis/export family protein [Rhodovulum tesquicola]|uniref:polysaccharide biosynthesis/export family protein n=1 Tax=Rhodovulum tesquicola TaxID=540254 RepID=UPI0020982769|nr:polysaccharide biosynthesis/export family protein [Rhodovulum tesquicola]MCO8145924.1 polysaccharide biosynthesis/export family protein [Rhodovulum tesquicola]